MNVEGGGVTNFSVNKWYSLFIFTTIFYYKKYYIYKTKFTTWLWFDLDGSLVPQSCCDPTSDMDRCQGLIPSNSPPSQAPPVVNVPVNYTLYTTVSPYTHSDPSVLTNLWSKDPLYLRMIKFLHRKYHLNTLQCILDCCKFSRSVDRT